MEAWEGHRRGRRRAEAVQKIQSPTCEGQKWSDAWWRWRRSRINRRWPTARWRRDTGNRPVFTAAKKGSSPQEAKRTQGAMCTVEPRMERTFWLLEPLEKPCGPWQPESTQKDKDVSRFLPCDSGVRRGWFTSHRAKVHRFLLLLAYSLDCRFQGCSE